MDTSRAGLAAFIRDQTELILRIWGLAVDRLPETRDLPPEVVRDDIHRVLERVAIELARDHACGEGELVEAVSEHVLRRSEHGVSHVVLAAEVMALRDAIQTAWPPRDEPEARETQAALAAVFDRILLAALDRFRSVRMRLLELIELVVRELPGATLDQALDRILHALVRSVAELDTAAILLRENDHLVLRATVGLEPALGPHRMWLGEGFAGLIAVERRPRLVRSAATDPVITNPMLAASRVRGLYGIPIVHRGELVGVAHFGSRSCEDFFEETKALVRAIMDRVVGLLYQEILRERLEREQLRYRAIVEAAPALIFSVDLEGRYLVVNRRALAEVGMTREDVIGKTARDVFPGDAADVFQAHMRRVLETRTCIEEIEQVPRRGGVGTYLAVRFPLFDARGELAGVGAVATDITERRRAELAQQLTAEIGGMLATTVDVEGTLALLGRTVVPAMADCCIIELLEGERAVRRALVHHRDPAKLELARALRRLAIDRGRAHLSQTVLERRVPIFMPEITDHYLGRIAQGDEHRELLRELAPRSMIQVPLVARGRLFGAWMFVRTAESPRYDPNDLRLACSLGELTSLGLDNERLHRLARHASEARDQMLGTVAHDLRNPINTILVALGAALEAVPEGTAPQALDAISRSAHRMDKLVADLLDEHAIESGQLALEPQPCRPAELVDLVVASQRERVEARALTLDVRIVGELPEVRADVDRVQQVFDNLIGNALKFTPTGGRVTIGAEPYGEDVRLFVADTGPGFAPEDLPHVFDRFWRARRADRRGTGLGLAICKGIVEAHGGRIWATNDGGARVWFTLPRARPHSLAGAQDQMSSIER